MKYSDKTTLDYKISMSTKIKLKEHCIGFTLYVDGNIVERDDKQLGAIYHKLVDKFIETRPEYVYSYVSELIRELGEVTDCDYCEQCHDTSYTYELEV